MPDPTYDPSRDPITIAVDFDGTCVDHRFPEVGPEVPRAVETLRDLANAGHRIILYTMRSGTYLFDAVKWCKERSIPLFGANNNKTQDSWTDSPKVYAHIYIDDAALGCPLLHSEEFNRPIVDWYKVREMLIGMGVL